MRILLLGVALAMIGCGDHNPMRPATPRETRPLDPLPATCAVVVEGAYAILVCDPPLP